MTVEMKIGEAPEEIKVVLQAAADVSEKQYKDMIENLQPVADLLALPVSIPSETIVFSAMYPNIFRMVALTQLFGLLCTCRQHGATDEERERIFEKAHKELQDLLESARKKALQWDAEEIAEAGSNDPAEVDG